MLRPRGGSAARATEEVPHKAHRAAIIERIAVKRAIRPSLPREPRRLRVRDGPAGPTRGTLSFMVAGPPRRPSFSTTASVACGIGSPISWSFGSESTLRYSALQNVSHSGAPTAPSQSQCHRDRGRRAGLGNAKRAALGESAGGPYIFSGTLGAFGPSLLSFSGCFPPSCSTSATASLRRFATASSASSTRARFLPLRCVNASSKSASKGAHTQFTSTPFSHVR